MPSACSGVQGDVGGLPACGREGHPAGCHRQGARGFRQGGESLSESSDLLVQTQRAVNPNPVLLRTAVGRHAQHARYSTGS